MSRPTSCPRRVGKLGLIVWVGIEGVGVQLAQPGCAGLDATVVPGTDCDQQLGHELDHLGPTAARAAMSDAAAVDFIIDQAFLSFIPHW